MTETHKSYRTEKLLDDTDEGIGPIRFKKGYHGLVCLNCTSYMSGVMNVFKTKKMAIQPRKNPPFSPQAFDDGKL